MEKKESNAQKELDEKTGVIEALEPEPKEVKTVGVTVAGQGVKLSSKTGDIMIQFGDNDPVRIFDIIDDSFPMELSVGKNVPTLTFSDGKQDFTMFIKPLDEA